MKSLARLGDRDVAAVRRTPSPGTGGSVGVDTGSSTGCDWDSGCGGGTGTGSDIMPVRLGHRTDSTR
jgi:hypothetical protein